MLGILSVDTPKLLPKVTAGQPNRLSTNCPRVSIRSKIACSEDSPMSWARAAVAHKVYVKSCQLYSPVECLQVRDISTIACWNCNRINDRSSGENGKG